MNTITHSIKTPSLTEFDLAPYTGKAIQYICLDEQDLSKLSNQGFIHTTHSPIIKLEQTTPLLLYVRMFHQTKKTAANRPCDSRHKRHSLLRYYCSSFNSSRAPQGLNLELYTPATPNNKHTMNKQRRKELEDLHDNLQNLLEKLETIMEEEEEYKDNLPENMLNRIEQSEIAIYSMQEACECITSAINTLEEIE